MYFLRVFFSFFLLQGTAQVLSRGGGKTAGSRCGTETRHLKYKIQNKKNNHSINFKVTCTIGSLSPKLKIKMLNYLFILMHQAKAYTCNRLKAWNPRLKDVSAMKVKLSHFIAIKWERNRVGFFLSAARKKLRNHRGKLMVFCRWQG